MAYKKKFKSSSGKYKSSSTASLALKKVNTLIKQYKPEIKVHDAGISAQNITFGGQVQNLSAIAIGDGQTTRDGHQICAKSIQLKAELRWNTGTTGDQTCSVYIIQDTQQVTDSTASFNEIFDSTWGPLCVLNREHFGRFKILSKKRYSCDDYKPIVIDQYVKLNLPIRYNNIGAFDYQKNGIVLVMVSSRLLNPPVMNWHSRMTFIDN